MPLLPSFSPLVTIGLFSMPVSLILYYYIDLYYQYFLDSTFKW